MAARLVPAGTSIVYTYDVFWEESTISWASRWDAYLKMPGGRVHWFSILNSLMVVLVMSSIVAMIMLRTIRKDLARYESILGETGKSNRSSFVTDCAPRHEPVLASPSMGMSSACNFGFLNLELSKPDSKSAGLTIAVKQSIINKLNKVGMH